MLRTIISKAILEPLNIIIYNHFFLIWVPLSSPSYWLFASTITFANHLENYWISNTYTAVLFTPPLVSTAGTWGIWGQSPDGSRIFITAALCVTVRLLQSQLPLPLPMRPTSPDGARQAREHLFMWSTWLPAPTTIPYASGPFPLIAQPSSHKNSSPMAKYYPLVLFIS